MPFSLGNRVQLKVVAERSDRPGSGTQKPSLRDFNKIRNLDPQFHCGLNKTMPHSGQTNVKRVHFLCAIKDVGY
jgi:hypothetical protein